MARLSIAAWIARLTRREVLRAYQVRRIAYADKYLVRRRYFTDGRIVEHSGTGPDALRDDEAVRAFEEALG